MTRGVIATDWKPTGRRLGRIFGGIRRLGEHEGIAVGTSQLIDCCTFAMAYLEAVPVPTSEDAWHVLWDRVLETRLISGLETDSTRIRMTDEYFNAFERAFLHCQARERD